MNNLGDKLGSQLKIQTINNLNNQLNKPKPSILNRFINFIKGELMKTILLVTTLNLFILFLAITNAFSGTVAQLNIKGVVPQLISVEISPEPIALNLPLNTTQNNTKIATITERCNDLSGYTVNITSQNQGKLRLNDDNLVVYNLYYNGQLVDLTSVSGSDFNNNFISAAPINKNINISYTGINIDNFAAGNYTDNITVTITAN